MKYGSRIVLLEYGGHILMGDTSQHDTGVLHSPGDILIFLMFVQTSVVDLNIKVKGFLAIFISLTTKGTLACSYSVHVYTAHNF